MERLEHHSQEDAMHERPLQDQGASLTKAHKEKGYTIDSDDALDPEYMRLKTELLSGKVSAEKVLARLTELDQSSLDRGYSTSNLKFLQDADILDLVDSSPNNRPGYYGFLSFTQVHVAQGMLSQNKIPEGVRLFEKAYDNAVAVGNPSNEDWRIYLRGTLLYLSGNTMGLEVCIRNIKSPNNKEVLERFLQGLQTRGTANYKKDYFGVA